MLAGARAGGGGRRAASERLRQALGEPLLALCLHVTGRRDDAADAAREALDAVDRALPSFAGAIPLATWVLRIALRASLRVRARRGDGEGRDPEMERLPAEPRVVLALFAIEGMSPADVAGVLGVPEATIWSRLHAARLELIASRPVS